MTNTPSRGEVWMVRFDPAIGDEQQKIRPAVVVSVPSVGRLQLRVVVPLTHWQVRYEAFAWFTYVPATPTNGLVKDSGADAFQVKSLSVQRFRQRKGSLTAAQMDEIASAIALCVGFSCP
jgi:mRNA interferase MazF